MKVAVVSRNPHRLEMHKNTLRPYLQHISPHPDVIIAVGGDGTFLAAERFYPGIPKLLVREDSICNKCSCETLPDALQKLLRERFEVQEFFKLEVRVGQERKEAANDVIVRNVHPTHAIRFTLTINGRKMPNEFIGDGIVVSTAFGSQGYFRSITGQHFDKGFGIAFNNTTIKRQPIIIPQVRSIVVNITRGLAHVAADNNPEIMLADKDTSIEITQSSAVARIIKF